MFVMYSPTAADGINKANKMNDILSYASLQCLLIMQYTLCLTMLIQCSALSFPNISLIVYLQYDAGTPCGAEPMCCDTKIACMVIVMHTTQFLDYTIKMQKCDVSSPIPSEYASQMFLKMDNTLCLILND